MTNKNDSYNVQSGKVLTPAGVEANIVEEITGAYRSITTDHGLIHLGKGFTLAGVMSISNGQTGGFFIAIPAGSYVHFKALSIMSDSAISVSLLEGYVKTAGDVVSTLTPVNRNRNSSNVSTLTVQAGTNVIPAVEAVYLTLATTKIGANLPSNKVGGSASGAEEWVLKANKNYCFAIANASGNTASVSYELFWYEELSGLA